MFKDSLKRMRIIKLPMLFAFLLFGFVLAGSVSVHAAEELQPTEAEYRTQYEDAVKLADMLRTSPYLLHNKLYTAEQEIELQALVDSVCDGKLSDRDKAAALLSCIADKLEPGECYELNGWDTLCDGDTEMTIVGVYDETSAPKRQAEEEVYCFTFYDVCRLAGIPCFILEDCKGELETNNQYICMVYIENASGAGKGWHFVDVMAENGTLIPSEDAYDVLGEDIFPMNILLDYEKMMNAMNVIFLNKETMLTYSGKSKITPYLAYDRDTDKVKTYFEDGTLADGEKYCRAEAYVKEDGEVPTGWIETKKYSYGTMTTYLQYSLYGVFLRGRVKKDDTEYNLQAEWNAQIPYNVEVGSEEESEEHKAYARAYEKKLQDKAMAVADALLSDENFIWNDTNFNEEDEKVVREAVDTALDWEYITGDEMIVGAFANAGISLDDEDPDNLSDRAKAEAILCYIRKNIEPLEHGPLFVNSADVLRQGGAICGSMSLLYRDMCVMAGIPCFVLGCSPDMDIGDTLFCDHAHNMVKVGDEWLFVDAMFTWIIGKGSAAYDVFIDIGYSTGFEGTQFSLDCEAMRNNFYYKWEGYYNDWNYYDFDSEGNLGIYRRNRKGEPIVTGSGFYKTDENGKYLQKNGLNTIDLTETSEDGTAQVVNRYAYYYQYGRLLEGEKVIDGKEYHFDTDVGGYESCHKVEELSRRYYIYKLEFKAIEDQPYNKDGVCPIPEIYHGDKKLELGKDFKIVEYTHNKEVTSYADASYKVEGIGDYLDDATRYFKIVQADISDVEVTLSETSYTWTPGQYYYRPEVDLDLDWQDYSVVYYDYNKLGQAKVVITGKRNYTGSITKYYDINPRVWNDKDFKILDRNKELLQSQEFSYNFYPVTPEAKVYWFDEEGTAQSLLEGYDYDISYSAADKPGIVTVTATAKGNYQGSVTCTYKINEYDIGNNSGVSRLMDQNQDSLKVRYTGSLVMPEIPDFGDLKEGVHYTMTVTDNVNAGTAKITLQGIGVCTGTYVKEFAVLPYILTENAINVEYRYTTYNGKVQKPSVSVNANLVEGRDYFVSYEKLVDGEYQETEPKEVGEYWIAIRVTGNVLIRQAGVSDEDAPDCYYIRYSINDDGTGNPDTGNEEGNSDADTGNEAGNSDTDTGNAQTGDNHSTIENPRTGGGTKDNNSVTGDADSVSKAGTSSVSVRATEENATNNTAYTIKKLKLTSMKKAIKLSWTKVKKAEGYQIQISLYKNYKKAKTIYVKKTKKSYTLKKRKKNKKYYIRIRAYRGNGKKKVYGKWRTSSKKT